MLMVCLVPRLQIGQHTQPLKCAEVFAHALDYWPQTSIVHLQDHISLNSESLLILLC